MAISGHKKNYYKSSVTVTKNVEEGALVIQDFFKLRKEFFKQYLDQLLTTFKKRITSFPEATKLNKKKVFSIKLLDRDMIMKMMNNSFKILLYDPLSFYTKKDIITFLLSQDDMEIHTQNTPNGRRIRLVSRLSDFNLSFRGLIVPFKNLKITSSLYIDPASFFYAPRIISRDISVSSEGKTHLGSSIYIHPHVGSNHIICFGEHLNICSEKMYCGDIIGIAQMADSLIHSYNHNGPFASLQSFINVPGVFCKECGNWVSCKNMELNKQNKCTSCFCPLCSSCVKKIKKENNLKSSGCYICKPPRKTLITDFSLFCTSCSYVKPNLKSCTCCKKKICNNHLKDCHGGSCYESYLVYCQKCNFPCPVCTTHHCKTHLIPSHISKILHDKKVCMVCGAEKEKAFLLEKILNTKHKERSSSSVLSKVQKFSAIFNYPGWEKE